MCLSETQCPLLRRFFFKPLTLKDDLDLSPLKMCRSMRYTCMPNIKFLSSILQKLWPIFKFSDRRTDGQFNCYMPFYLGHEKILIKFFWLNLLFSNCKFLGKFQLLLHIGHRSRLYVCWVNPHIPKYGSPHVRYSLNRVLQLSYLFYMIRIHLFSEHSNFSKGHIILKYYSNGHCIYLTKSANYTVPCVCTFIFVAKTVRT